MGRRGSSWVWLRTCASGTLTRGVTGDMLATMLRRCGRCCSRETADDYVVGTGETHSVRELCQLAFGYLDLDWERYVVTDGKFFRPAEVDLLVSDPGKARARLGWAPEVSFEHLIQMMVDADLALVRRENL